MKTSKKVLSVFLSLLLVALMLPFAAVPASALESFGQCGDNIEWAFFSNTGELVLSGTGPMYDYSYSEQTGYDSPFHAARDLIKSVKIYDSITTIGAYAFADCDELKTVKIYAESLTKICGRAFNGCAKLESVTFECDPHNLNSIGAYAFYNCYRLKTFDIPYQVNTLGGKAISGISATRLTIPAGLENFYVYDFAECPNLASITVDSGNPYFSSIDGCLYNKDGTALYVVPAKYGKSSIKVSYEVTEFSTYAFDACNGLTDIYYMGTDTAWALITNSNRVPSRITVHYGMLTAVGQCGENVSYALYSDGRLVISGTGPMGDNDIYKLRGFIKYVEIQNGVTEIANSAFSYCNNLESVSIANSVTKIGYAAFERCKKLESVTTPASVATIGSFAFELCTSLETVEILGNPELGPDLFKGCENLKNVKLSSTLTKIGDGMFEDCVGLESFTVPSGVSKIYYDAFKNCKLTSVTLYPNLTYISANAFDGCSDLTDVYYFGTRDMWENVVDSGHHELNAAQIHYGACKITAQADVGGQLLSAEERFVRTGDSVMVSAKPDGTNVFDGWYNGETKVSGDMDYSFTVTEDVNLTAKFKAFVKVDVFPNRSSGTIAGAGGQPFGSEVTLTATPKNGYRFVGWYRGGQLLSSDPTYTFTLTGYSGSDLYAKFEITDEGSLAILNNNGYFQIPTRDSDDLVDGDKWFNLDMILSMMVHYPQFFGIEEGDLEATLDLYRNATYFYHYGNEQHPSIGDVLVYANGDITWGESIPIDLYAESSDFNLLMIFYGLETHGAPDLAEGFAELPLADDTALAEGDYWFDLLGWETDNGLLAEEYTHDLDYEESITKFYIGTVNDTLTLRTVQFDADVFDVTAEDDSAVPGLWNYLHKHVDLVDYQPLPTADSDEMAYGEKWLDLADFCDWASYEGNATEQEIAAYGNAAYYLYEDGSKIKAVANEEATVYEAGQKLYDFLHSYGVDLAEGYTLMPYAESDDLANGAYYFDKAAFLAELEGATAAQVDELLSYTKLYINADGTDVKSIMYNTFVDDLTPELYAFIRQHLVPQEVILVDAEAETAVVAAPGVLTEDVNLVVEAIEAMNVEAVIPDLYIPLANVKIDPYEISLIDGAGYVVQPNGTVTVMLPLPEDFDPETTEVYYTDDDGNMIDMKAYILNGYVFFTAEHFSKYVIVDTTCLHNGETEVRDTVEANCHTAGYTGDTYCAVCGDMIAAGSSTGLDENNHEGDTELRGVVTGNCHTDGYTGDLYCLGCGNVKEAGHSTGKDMSKHDGGTEVRNAKAATCKTDGYTGDTYCKGCNNKIATGAVISKDTVAHTPGAVVRENVVDATTEHGGSYDEVVRCTVCGAVISSTHKTTNPLPKPADPKPANQCKWCGKVHEGFFQKIVGFFHNIFAAIFGAKY